MGTKSYSEETTRLHEEINRLKKEKGAVIMAHYYTNPEIHGKSFHMNSVVRQLHEQGTDVVMVLLHLSEVSCASLWNAGAWISASASF